MRETVVRLCDCGSGEYSQWEYDAKGIELCRCCDRCRAKKLAGYRPEIISGYTQADVNDPIEPEEPERFESDWGEAAEQLFEERQPEAFKGE